MLLLVRGDWCVYLDASVCMHVSTVLLVNPGQLDCQGIVPMCLGTLQSAHTVMTGKGQGLSVTICVCERLTILWRKKKSQAQLSDKSN